MALWEGALLRKTSSLRAAAFRTPLHSVAVLLLAHFLGHTLATHRRRLALLAIPARSSSRAVRGAIEAGRAIGLGAVLPSGAAGTVAPRA